MKCLWINDSFMRNKLTFYKNIVAVLLIGAYNNYGVLKQKINEIDSAFYFYQKSLKLSIQKKDSIGIPFAQTHIGEVFMLKRNFDIAEKYFNNALKIRQKRKDMYGIADSFLYLGDLFYAQKEYKTAIYYKLKDFFF